MKFSILVFTIMLAILWVGCGSKSSENKASSDTTQQDKQQGMKMRGKPGSFNPEDVSAIPVEVTYITRGDISSFLIYSSVLETEQTVNIFSRISGLVEKLYVEEGQYVRKNHPLLQLEQEEYILAMEKAQFEFEKAKREYERLQALLEKNLISQEEFENARISMRQAEISLKQAQLNLDYTIVKSPINGVIGEREVRLGDRIQPSNRLFVISNLDDKVVKVFVPQEELMKIYPKQPAVITTDVTPGLPFTGAVKRVSPIIDPQSGTFKVTIAVKDPENKLKPGMFVNAELIVDTHQNTKLIPKTSLIYEGERAFYFIVKGDSVERVELQKGFEDSEKVEVLNDVPVGMPVVVLGQSGLKTGSRVTIFDKRKYAWQKSFPEEDSINTAKKNSDKKTLN